MWCPTAQIMGILNVTPDSFSDGGKFLKKQDAIHQAFEMVREGADIIDVGGESTRPGSVPISLQEELDRVVPVIEAIHADTGVTISVDTTKFEVATEAVKAGATIINDVSGGQDVRMAGLVKDKDLTIILMHKKGTPANMQDAPRYENGVVAEVKDFLRQRRRAFQEVGIPAEKIWWDPGIGFGKTTDHNLDLLRHLEEFIPGPGKLVVGTSRKAFLAKLLGDPELPFQMREAGTLATNLWALTKGAQVFRVHQVGELKRALRTWEAVLFGI
jgi:dihydropteroate synthase